MTQWAGETSVSLFQCFLFFFKEAHPYMFYMVLSVRVTQGSPGDQGLNQTLIDGNKDRQSWQNM